MTAAAGGAPLTRAEFDSIFAACDNRGRWGTSDQRGSLNLIGPQQVREAAKLVTTGRTVSCAWDLDVNEGPDNPHPVKHDMTLSIDDHLGDSGELRVCGDRFEMDIHGDAHSHIDSLCHVAFADKTWNGAPTASVIGPHGALQQGIELLRDGLVTRGVLLDIPRLRGIDWLEPGTAIGPDELQAAEQAAATRLRPGDMLLLRTGHASRRRRLGPWDASTAKAGLHATALPFLRQRDLVGVGYDGDGEVEPSETGDVRWPIHAISLPALGWWTMDSLDLDALAEECTRQGRWEFMFVLAPLRLVGGTGSPINPIAIF